MSSTEMPFSSDDSFSLDVSKYDKDNNPWGEMDVNQIPIEIVDQKVDLDSGDVEITGENKGKEVRFLPLNHLEWKSAALKFSLILNPRDHIVQYSGINTVLPKPPIVTLKAKANGMCLFNTLSILLSGRDTYAAIIRHVICNYICNPVKYGFLKTYIPPEFTSGHEYIQKRNMCKFDTWGTEVEMFTFAQLSGYYVYVYTQQGEWALFNSEIDATSEKAFYLSNESGGHFNPVLNGSG